MYVQASLCLRFLQNKLHRIAWKERISFLYKGDTEKSHRCTTCQESGVVEIGAV